MTAPTTILIIDDDPDLLLAQSRLLRGTGYAVTAAATGQEGLLLAREIHPEIVLLAVALPDHDGVDVCRQMKADLVQPAPYVLLVSDVLTDTEFQALALELGADGYIARPISNRELLARVALYIRLKQAEDRRREERASYERQLQERITALEQANATLREKEAQFRFLAENANDVIWTVDADGRFTYVLKFR